MKGDKDCRNNGEVGTRTRIEIMRIPGSMNHDDGKVTNGAEGNLDSGEEGDDSHNVSDEIQYMENFRKCIRAKRTR